LSGERFGKTFREQWLTATELLEFHGRLCGVDTGRLRERVPYLVDLVGLDPHRGKRRPFSGNSRTVVAFTSPLIVDDAS
jgi:ABC-type multidrug transport system ATPase subunit